MLLGYSFKTVEHRYLQSFKISLFYFKILQGVSSNKIRLYVKYISEQINFISISFDVLNIFVKRNVEVKTNTF